MSVVLDLEPEAEWRLRTNAAENGSSVSNYVEVLIKKDAAFRDVERRLAPVRESFEKSGMTEDELDQFMNSVLAKVRAEKRAR